MVLASVGLLIPALFHAMIGPGEEGREHTLSLGVSVVLILSYGLNLLFNLVTHRDLFGHKGEVSPLDDEPGPWGLRRSATILLVSTAFVAWMSEILVGAVEAAGHTLGMNEVFMGVVVVAIVGNAAEHSTAILMAMKNQMDLAVGIAMGSALQVALFVAPVLVFASRLRTGHGPMDLLFSTFEVVSVIIAAIVARMAAEDGESNWLEGAMLLMLYVILGFAFYLLPVGRLRPTTLAALPRPKVGRARLPPSRVGPSMAHPAGASPSHSGRWPRSEGEGAATTWRSPRRSRRVFGMSSSAR